MKKIYFLTLVTLFAFTGAKVMAQTQPAQENLKHSWTFEGDANDQVGEAHGTVEGASFDDGGVITGADAGVTIPGDVVAINEYEEVTIDLWYQSAGDQANNGFTMCLYMGDTNDLGVDGFFMSMSRGNDADNGPYSRVGMSCGNYSEPWTAESGCNVFTEPDDGELHHAVAIIDATNIYYYFDGELSDDSPVALAENNALANLSNNYFWVGHGGYTGDPWYEGTIYQINIFDKALNEDEVGFLYEAGPVPLSYETTSIETLQNQLKVSYNAANIQISGVENIVKSELINLSGQRIRTFNNEHSLNVSDVQSGNYILKVTSQEGIAVTKVMVR